MTTAPPPLDGSVPQPPFKEYSPFDTFEAMRLPRLGATLEAATVTGTGARLTLSWGGATVANVPYIGQRPAVGDRVWLLHQGSTLIVMGVISGANGLMYGGTLHYTASGSFVKATYPGLRAITAKVQAGGGGGGGAPATGAGESSAGSGGGAGAYGEKFILASALSGSETITIGAGGTAPSGAAGNNGSPSSFGSHLSANGGLGGNTINAGSTPANAEGGGNQGTTSGADLSIAGQHGGIGYRASAAAGTFSGDGGSSMYGRGGTARGSNSNGANGGTGAGGSGAKNGVSQSGRPGGTGGNGSAVVDLWF